MEDYECDCVKTVSAKAIITIDESVLLLRDEDGHVDLPGGRLRCGEGVVHALRRELKEELGVSGWPESAPAYTFAWHNRRRKAHGLILVFRFRCRRQTCALSSLKARELGLTVVWAKVNSLSNQPFPSFFRNGYAHIPWIT
jgi:ADP-ribose pyrophosphatase YjhB (NUDIX family)